MRTDRVSAAASTLRRVIICVSISATCSLAFSFSAFCADIHWDNGGTGTAWSTGANWDDGSGPDGVVNGGLDGVPGAADRANVSFNSGSATAPGSGVNGPVTFNTTTTVSSVRIGGNTGAGFGGAGMFQMNGGTLTVDNTGGTGTGFQLAITNNGTLDGTFEMNGAGTVLNVRDGNFETAVSGTGVATINNGTLNQLTNNLIVGQNNSSNATFNMNGGLVDLQNQLRIANNAATGLFTQTNGTVNVGTTFAMSDHGGGGASDSTANISGGTLNISDRAGGGWLIGSTNNGASSADATVSGTADVNVIRTGVRIADRGANSVGTLTLTGGTIDVDGGNTEVADDGTGTLDIQGGTYSQNTNNIIVGQLGTSDATMTVSGGTVDINDQLRIANRGTGLFDQSGGVVNVGTILDLANVTGSTSTATVQLSGGNLNVGDRVNSDLIIGNEDTAASTSLVEVSGTGTLRVSDEISIAQTGSNSTGTLDIQAGLVESRSNVIVGNNGDGDLTISGGTLNVANDLPVAPPSDFSAVTNTGAVNADMIIGVNNSADGSSVTQTGGTVNVGADPGAADADLFIGRGADATYTISDGVLNVLGTDGDIFVADNASSNSNFNVSANADVNIGDRLLLGQTGNGDMLMTGGTVDMGTNFIVGQDAGSDGFLDLDGGTVTVGGVMEVGQTGTGEVDQDGGFIDVNGGDITLSVNNGSIGTWNIASGQVDTNQDLNLAGNDNGATNTDGNLTVSGTADVNVAGRLRVGQEGDGDMTMTGGTVDVTGNTIIGQNGSADGFLDLDGGTITIGGLLDVGQTGTGEVDQDGGLVDVNGGNINLGALAGSTGTWNVAAGQVDTSASLVVGSVASGQFTQRGTADVNVAANVVIGSSATSDGTYNMDGGTLDATDLSFGASTTTPLFQQTAGTATFTGNVTDGTGTSQLFIDGGSTTVGGTMTVDQLRVGSSGLTGNLFMNGGGTSTVNTSITFGGAMGTIDLSVGSGTLNLADVTANGTNLITGGTVDLNGSRTFNVTGGNTTIASDIAGGGGETLIKDGNGTLTLSGTNNTYLGDTNVTDGILALSGAGTNNIPNSPTITVDSGATLDVTALAGFEVAVNQTLAGGGTVVGNTIVPSGAVLSPGGASVDTLIFNGNLNVGGADDEDLLFDLGSGGDQVILTGTNVLTIGPGFGVSDFDFNLLAGAGTYVLFDTNEDIIGDLGVTNITFNPGVLGILSFANGANGMDDLLLSVTLIPEPSTMVLGILALVGLGLGPCRRRRARP